MQSTCLDPLILSFFSSCCSSWSNPWAVSSEESVREPGSLEYEDIWQEDIHLDLSCNRMSGLILLVSLCLLPGIFEGLKEEAHLGFFLKIQKGKHKILISIYWLIFYFCILSVNVWSKRDQKMKRKEEVGGKEAGDRQRPPSAQPRTPSSAPLSPLSDPDRLQVITPFTAGWLPHMRLPAEAQPASSSLGTFRLCPLASLVQAVFYLFGSSWGAYWIFPPLSTVLQFFPWGGEFPYTSQGLM